MGQRARKGGTGSNQHVSKPDTVSGLQTTADIAEDLNVSERTVQRYVRIGEDVSEEAAEIVLRG